MSRLFHGMTCVLLLALLAAHAQPAHAVNMLPAGFAADDSSSLWNAPNPHIFALEIFNTLAPAPGTSFGMFFASAPEQRIPIFTPADPRNGALLYLEVGQLYLGPTLAPAGTFDPSPFQGGDAFGFYMQVEDVSGARILHTLPGLNDGLVDAVSAHPALAGGSYLLSFDFGNQQFAMQMITGLQPHQGSSPYPLADVDVDPDGQSQTPVPEPESWLVFALGLGLVLHNIERKRRA